MHAQAVELVPSKRRCPRTAASCDVTASSERPPRKPAKMMFTTCFGRAWRRDRVRRGPPALERQDLVDATPPPARAAARQQLSPTWTPPPGRSQYSRARLLMAQRRIFSSRRRMAHPDTRLHQRFRRAEASLATLALGELLDFLGRTAGTAGRQAVPHAPRLRVNVRSRSVFRRQTLSSPRYPESMSPGDSRS